MGIFGRHHGQIPDKERDPVAYGAWEDKLFGGIRVHFVNNFGGSGEVYTALEPEFRARGMGSAAMGRLPDSVAHLVESAAENPGVVAPRLYLGG